MVCGCGDPAHHLLFTLDDEDPQVWLHYQLLLEPWYKRVWYGLRYIFGHQSRYGMYGELVINESNIDKFQEIINHVRPAQWLQDCCPLKEDYADIILTDDEITKLTSCFK